MARTTKPLTDKEIKACKPKAKEYKLFDGGGLYLSITPKGQKWWRLKYRFNGKECRISLGVYPLTTLADARSEREKLKKLIKEGINPSQTRKEEKEATKQDEIKKENTFYNVSQKWWLNYKDQVSENYHTRLGRALENYVYPTIKSQPIDTVKRLDIIAIIEDLKSKELLETARRTVTILNKIFKYAVTKELTTHNIIADIEVKDILGKKVKKHYPTITKDKEVRGLLQTLGEYRGDYSTQMALRLLPYVFVRSFNIRHMEWEEINFKTKEWTIPAHKMKTKEEFILPLPHQAIEILNEIKEYPLRHPKYLFISPIKKDKPISDNTLISALRRMGYTKEELVPHSFRSMFSTIAHEKENDTDNGHPYGANIIEACLAHKDTNEVARAYNHAKYKKPMRELIQWYANYLEGLKNDR